MICIKSTDEPGTFLMSASNFYDFKRPSICFKSLMITDTYLGILHTTTVASLMAKPQCSTVLLRK